jgi:D-glycero-alpha-D-manno-heptose-7-phosphate kinase
VSQEKLAKEACHIDIEVLNEPVGKLDHYISAFGGIKSFTFLKDDSVRVEPLNIREDVLNNLEDNLLLFFAGFAGSASAMPKDQRDSNKSKDDTIIEDFHSMKKLGYDSKQSLESGDLARFAELMSVQWEQKKQRSGAIGNREVEHWYKVGMENGAAGGTPLGTGVGGFLMFYSDDNTKLRQAMAREGLRETHFNFDFEGSKVVVQS